MKVYEKVNAYLLEKGINTAALSHSIGIPHSRLVSWLNGEVTLYAEELKMICLALNVSPELFVEVQSASAGRKT